MGDFGKLLILFGAILMGVGVLLTVLGKVPWLGRLPGDISYKSDNVTVSFPIVTCLVISVVVSLILYLFRR